MNKEFSVKFKSDGETITRIIDEYQIAEFIEYYEVADSISMSGLEIFYIAEDGSHRKCRYVQSGTDEDDGANYVAYSLILNDTNEVIYRAWTRRFV